MGSSAAWIKKGRGRRQNTQSCICHKGKQDPWSHDRQPLLGVPAAPQRPLPHQSGCLRKRPLETNSVSQAACHVHFCSIPYSPGLSWSPKSTLGSPGSRWSPVYAISQKALSVELRIESRQGLAETPRDTCHNKTRKSKPSVVTVTSAADTY